MAFNPKINWEDGKYHTLTVPNASNTGGKLFINTSGDKLVAGNDSTPQWTLHSDGKIYNKNHGSSSCVGFCGQYEGCDLKMIPTSNNCPVYKFDNSYPSSVPSFVATTPNSLNVWIHNPYGENDEAAVYMDSNGVHVTGSWNREHPPQKGCQEGQYHVCQCVDHPISCAWLDSSVAPQCCQLPLNDTHNIETYCSPDYDPRHPTSGFCVDVMTKYCQENWKDNCVGWLSQNPALGKAVVQNSIKNYVNQKIQSSGIKKGYYNPKIK